MDCRRKCVWLNARPPACSGKADIIVTMPTKKNGSSKVVGGAFVVLGKAAASWGSPYHKNIDSMTAAEDGFSISVPEVPSFRLSCNPLLRSPRAIVLSF